jgi:hypothetical protein
MATYLDSDILITTIPGSVKLSLTCGYGQPVVTSVYLKKTDNSSQKIMEFYDNVNELEIGQSTELKFNKIEIHSTIHDIRDFAPGQEVEDINLYIKISCNDVAVDMEIIKKTKGKGELINCMYEVTIL